MYLHLAVVQAGSLERHLDGSTPTLETRKAVQIKETPVRGLPSSSTIPLAASHRGGFIESHKLEDQMNLQHLKELMEIFNVRGYLSNT